MSQFLFGHLSSRYPFQHADCFGLGRIQPQSISKQECPGREKPGAFITVHEWVIPNYAVTIGGRQFKQRRICKFLSVSGPRQGPFQSSFVTEARTPPKLMERFGMQCQHELLGKPSGLVTLWVRHQLFG